jgi:hypothetical protein
MPSDGVIESEALVHSITREELLGSLLMRLLLLGQWTALCLKRNRKSETDNGARPMYLGCVSFVTVLPFLL